MKTKPGSERDWQLFLTTALENANDAIILYDVASDGRSFVISYVNRMFEEQTGYRRDEVLGRGPELLWGPETDMEAAAVLGEALLQLQPSRGELLKYRKNGSTIWAELNMRPLMNDAGELIGAVAIQRDVTRRKFAEEQFDRTRTLLDAIMTHTRNVVSAKDLHGRYLFVNAEFERLHAVDAESMLGRTDFDIFPDAVARRLRDADRKALESATPVTHEEIVPANGRDLTYLSVKFPLLDGDGEPYATCGIATDITERAETLNQLQLLQLALDQASDAIVVFRLDESDQSWRVEYVNEMMIRTTGYERAELVGNTTDMLTGPKTDVAALERSRDTLKNGFDTRIELTIYRKDGSPIWVELNASPMMHRDGHAPHTVVVYRDITQKKQREEQLSFEATHDPLTAAFNRRYLERSLERSIADARERATEHGFLFFDLDGFKEVNDVHGHEAGDKLLAALTVLISSRLRRGDILARLGGDEFAVLLLGCSIEQSNDIAQELLHAIDRYGYPWKGARLHVSASAGVALIDSETASSRNVLRAADEACYGAKRAGKNRVYVAGVGLVSNADP